LQNLPEKSLHIVSFDVPFPANYGGVIDIFYKIKNLHKLGVSIKLHCFEYGRGEQKELEKYCEEVHYYKRNLNKALLMHSSPFIVVSRRDARLIKNLRKDDAPILFEGLHSCFLFSNTELRNRKKFIRAHNVEHNYYRGLAKATKNIFRKSYFKSESRKLESFEKIMNEANAVISISEMEYSDLSSRYNNVKLVFPFHGNDGLKSASSKEQFAFYHGNLGVGENNKAALFLAKEVFRQINYPLIIAGRNPSKELKEIVSQRENVKLFEDKNNDEIIDLIQKAQINILPTFQSTGVKLKLINALFNGGFCLVNSQMVKGTGLEELCLVKNGRDEMRAGIQELRTKQFGSTQKNKRQELLFEKLSDTNNAKALIDIIFEDH